MFFVEKYKYLKIGELGQCHILKALKKYLNLCLILKSPFFSLCHIAWSLTLSFLTQYFCVITLTSQINLIKLVWYFLIRSRFLVRSFRGCVSGLWVCNHPLTMIPYLPTFHTQMETDRKFSLVIATQSPKLHSSGLNATYDFSSLSQKRTTWCRKNCSLMLRRPYSTRQPLDHSCQVASSWPCPATRLRTSMTLSSDAHLSPSQLVESDSMSTASAPLAPTSPELMALLMALFQCWGCTTTQPDM